MDDTGIFATTVASAAALLALCLTVGECVEHRAGLAAAWRDGVAVTAHLLWSEATAWVAWAAGWCFPYTPGDHRAEVTS